jgi:hypothetical protein
MVRKKSKAVVKCERAWHRFEKHDTPNAYFPSYLFKVAYMKGWKARRLAEAPEIRRVVDK